MDSAQLQDLACQHISDMVDQLVVLQERGDVVGMTILHNEIKDLTAALDSDDASSDIFYAPRLRYEWVD